MIAAGEDARIHRPAPDHQRLGGRRQRRSSGAPGRRSRPRRRSTTSACPKRSTPWPRRRPTSPPRPSQTRSGRAYGAAMADVLRHGSLPVPNHLRSAGDRRMKTHGIGVGYRFPHDFEGDDVATAVPPRRARRSALLRPGRPGVRGDHRCTDGGPREGAAREAPTEAADRPADGVDERRDEAEHGEPQEARRDAEEGRELAAPALLPSCGLPSPVPSPEEE